MKKLLFVLFAISLFSIAEIKAQKVYVSASTEMIFSWASIDDNGYDKGSRVRWSPVLNLQGMVNYDPASFIGFFTGLAVRNVGFIHYPENSNYFYVYRNYSLGIPIGLKLGKMKGMLFYGGYEFEFPFNYKEKEFEGSRSNKRQKDIYWFTDRVEQVQQSFLVGIEFPYGFNLKFKYYLTNFHNQDFTTTDPETGELYKPYSGLESQVFYISLNIGLFSPVKQYYEGDAF